MGMTSACSSVVHGLAKYTTSLTCQTNPIWFHSQDLHVCAKQSCQVCQEHPENLMWCAGARWTVTKGIDSEIGQTFLQSLWYISLKRPEGTFRHGGDCGLESVSQGLSLVTSLIPWLLPCEIYISMGLPYIRGMFGLLKPLAERSWPWRGWIIVKHGFVQLAKNQT